MSTKDLVLQSIEREAGEAEDNYRRSQAGYGEAHPYTQQYKNKWHKLLGAIAEMKEKLK